MVAMENPKLYVKKGYYTHREPGVCISFTNYLVIERDSHYYLLFQVENDSEIDFHTLTIQLTQTDGDRNLLSNEEITVESIDLKAHGTYYLSRGLLLHPGCRDFRIRAIAAHSIPYRYTFHNGYTIAHYDIRDYLKKPEKKATAPQLRPHFPRRGRLIGALTALGFLSVLLFCLLPAIIGWGRTGEMTHYSKPDTALVEALSAWRYEC